VNLSSANRLPYSAAVACWYVAGVVALTGVVGARGLRSSPILAAVAPLLSEATGLQVGACRGDATVELGLIRRTLHFSRSHALLSDALSTRRVPASAGGTLVRMAVTVFDRWRSYV